MTEQRTPDGEDDDSLDGAIAGAFARRGELIPTSLDEVRAAEEAGVEVEDDLPASLATFEAPRSGASSPRPAETDSAEPARSQRVPSTRLVSLDDARRAPERRRSPWAHVATFALGAAMAAGAMLVLRPRVSAGPTPEPGAGVPHEPASAAPATSSRVAIGPVSRCGAECCAGASCSAAQGELKACASGRACVACTDPSGRGDAYRLRLGLFSPTERLADQKLEDLEWCARVPTSEWSCLPLRAQPGATAALRSFSRLVTSAELAAGLEIELRAHGETKPLGHYRDSVRVGATALCRGVGALVVDDKDEHLGSLALYLDDTHYVEMARSDDALALVKRRGELDLADEAPALFETRAKGAERFVLAVGPLDAATAERLRWALLDRGQPAKVTVGDDYEGEPRPLP